MHSLFVQLCLVFISCFIFPTNVANNIIVPLIGSRPVIIYYVPIIDFSRFNPLSPVPGQIRNIMLTVFTPHSSKFPGCTDKQIPYMPPLTTRVGKSTSC